MRVLSLFDGISCARVALERAGIPVDVYCASEIDKHAVKIAQKNYPDTIQVGSVVGFTPPRGMDLLIGGSPCQDLSIAKKNRKGLAGDRSSLFYEYVRILREAEPRYFILENVASMPKEARDAITKELGVEPIMIDAALVSAQRRKRYFWTNIPNVSLPEDRGIFLKDIIEYGYAPDEKGLALTASYGKKTEKDYFEKSKGQVVVQSESVYQYRRTYWRETKGGKVPTLTANMGTGGNNVPYIEQRARGFNKGGKRALDGKVPTLSKSAWEDNNKLVMEGPITIAVIPEAERPKGNYLPRERVLSDRGKFRAVSTAVNQQPWIGTEKYVRKLTPVECERLQSLPDGYTEGVSNTQRYKAIGNAFNVEVIAHILRHIPHERIDV